MKAFPYDQGREDGDGELRGLFARRAEALKPATVPSLESVLAEAGPEVSQPALPMFEVPARRRVRTPRAWAAAVATLAIAASFAGLRVGFRDDGRGISAEPSGKVVVDVASVGGRISEPQTCEALPMTLASSADMCTSVTFSRAPAAFGRDEASSEATCYGPSAPASDGQRLTCEREAMCSFSNP